MTDSSARKEQVRSAQAAYKEKMRAGGYVQKTVWINHHDLSNLTVIKAIINAEGDRPDLTEFLARLESQLSRGKQGRPKKIE